MRVLVTGRGSIAQRHVGLLRQRVPGLQAIVVSSTGRVDAALEPAAVVNDFASGLRRKPDAVIIASPSIRHAAELEACLQRALPCLAEKPLAVSREQLARLESATASAARAGAVVVGCNLRYLPALKCMAQEFRGGRIGALVRASFEVGQDLRQWRPQRAPDLGYSGRASEGGGVVFDLVHEIDLARWMLGPLQVHCAIGGHRSTLPIDSEDVHVALLRDQAGAPVVIGLDYLSRPAVRRHSLVGESGTLVCDVIARQLVLGTEDGVTMLGREADFEVASTYHSQMEDWLASIRSDTHAVESPLAEGLATASLMLAMKEAA